MSVTRLYRDHYVLMAKNPGQVLQNYNDLFLIHKQMEMHGCILSIVATDALVLKAPGHQ